MKKCKNKNCTVPVTEQRFNKKASSKDGLATVCKVCKAEKDRLYRELNKETLREKKREYRINNLEKVKYANKVYYENNKEVISEKTKQYRELNKQVIKDKKAAYYKTEAGKLVSKNAKNTRRALKISTSDNTVTKEYLDTLLIVQEHKCFYCKTKLNLLDNGNVHLEHYIPLSKGGAHSCGNVVWSCSTCNLNKRTEIPNTPLVFPIKFSKGNQHNKEP